MIERGGQLHAVVTNGGGTLMGLARKHIDIEATVYTDEHMPVPYQRSASSMKASITVLKSL